MKKHTKKCIGMDTYKNTIIIAIADQERDGEIRNYGTIPTHQEAIDRFIRKQTSKNI